MSPLNYEVDGLGRRIVTSGGSSTLSYVYTAGYQILGIYSKPSDTSDETVYVGDLPVALVKKVDSSSSVVYATHTDQLGTVREIADANGRAVWLWGGEPFGASSPDEDPSGLGQFANRSRFPGQYFDIESGLSYNVHRDYNATTGRYVQSDPLGLMGGLSTYLYVNADPLGSSDILGLCPDNDESGRYAPCNASQDPNSSWLANKLVMWGCKKTIDRTCNSAEGSTTCCEADYNECTDGRRLGEPPGNAKEALTMGRCMVKFQKCTSAGGKGN